MRLIINRGIPGSGKSTGVKKLTEGMAEHVFYVCSSDNYAGLYDKDGNFHPELLSKSHPWCMAQAISCMQAKRPLVIIDNTNVDAVAIAPYLLVGQAFGYEVEIHRYDAGSIDEAHERNTHRVPLETCIRMHKAMQAPLPSHWPKEKVFKTHKGA